VVSGLRAAIFAVLLATVAAVTAIPIRLPAVASATDGATAKPDKTTGKPAHHHRASPLRAARTRLAQAHSQLVQARQQAAALRTQADSAAKNTDVARRDMGNFVREAYTTGPSDLVSLATIFDVENPADTLRRAAVAERVAEHQESQWQEAQRILGSADALRAQARQVVNTATDRYDAAADTVNTIRGRDILAEIGKQPAAMNGLSTLSEQCDKADVTIDLCEKPPWSERNLTFDSVIVERYAHAAWPQLRKMYGYRPYDPFPDHPTGRATDLMMPHDGTTDADVALGNEIAHYFQEHAAEYGIYYMIWRQRIWKANDPTGQWTAMSDRGSPTANHMDHVHVSVTNGRVGTAFDEALSSAEPAK
jgi:hypothetical protein